MTTLDLENSIPGDIAEVVRIDGADALAQRLEASGFWPGTEVATVRRAPFGGPIEFRLRGFRLALRRSEARRVIVRPMNVRPFVAPPREVVAPPREVVAPPREVVAPPREVLARPSETQSEFARVEREPAGVDRPGSSPSSPTIESR